jgi:hypothetical protein
MRRVLRNSYKNSYKVQLLVMSYERDNSGGSTQTERIGTGSTEEYKRSACEDLKCDLKVLSNV